jgi:nucleotide-binding universal stress UspA family protein
MFKHILLSADGSARSENAAQVAIALAKSLGARITAVYVMPPYSKPPDYPIVALGEVEALARAEGVELSIAVETGAAWEAILKAAMQLQPDLIALPAHGGETGANAIIDGDTTRVVVNTRVPVLICR